MRTLFIISLLLTIGSVALAAAPGSCGAYFEGSTALLPKGLFGAQATPTAIAQLELAKREYEDAITDRQSFGIETYAGFHRLPDIIHFRLRPEEIQNIMVANRMWFVMADPRDHHVVGGQIIGLASPWNFLVETHGFGQVVVPFNSVLIKFPMENIEMLLDAARYDTDVD